MILQVGVKALLQNKSGKYLLLRRNSHKYKIIDGQNIDGEWDIVGGRIIPGSSLIENLRREIEEETGLILTTIPKLIAAQDILRVAGRHVVRLTYFAKIKGQPKLDKDENIEYKWLSLKN